MLLETSRLLLRQFKDSDLEAFLAYRNDPEVAKYQGWDVPYPRHAAVEFVHEMARAIPAPGKWIQTAIELKSTREMIGDVAFYIKRMMSGRLSSVTVWRVLFGVAGMPLRRLQDYLAICSADCICIASLLNVTSKMRHPGNCSKNSVSDARRIWSRISSSKGNTGANTTTPCWGVSGGNALETESVTGLERCVPSPFGA